jgi:hypothetical protein
MCPACWAMVAMVTAGVASTGTLGALSVAVVRSRLGKQQASAGQIGQGDKFNLDERRSDDEHGDRRA